MAAGKTTVARLLAQRFERGVHVEGDVFRRSIVTGREEVTPDLTKDALQQLRLRYRIAAATADLYAGEGFTAVLEDVVAGPMLEEVAGLVQTRPLHVVVLMPTVKTLAKRAASRPNAGYDHWTIEELHAGFVEGTPRLGLWLDTTEHSPEQTVDAILAATGAGEASG